MSGPIRRRHEILDDDEAVATISFDLGVVDHQHLAASALFVAVGAMLALSLCPATGLPSAG